MTRHRFQDITNCVSFTVPHDGVGADDVSVVHVLYINLFPFLQLIYISGPMARYSAIH